MGKSGLLPLQMITVWFLINEHSHVVSSMYDAQIVSFLLQCTVHLLITVYTSTIQQSNAQNHEINPMITCGRGR